MNSKQRRVLVLFVDNSSGVLNRITLLFSQKGFNIETITCSVTCVPSISRMTIVTEGDDTQISHIIYDIKQNRTANTSSFTINQIFSMGLFLNKLSNNTLFAHGRDIINDNIVDNTIP